MTISMKNEHLKKYLDKPVIGGFFTKSYPTRYAWITDFLIKNKLYNDCDDTNITLILKSFLEKHDNKPWYQRWWIELIQPIEQLKQCYVIAILLHEIEQHKPITTNEQRLADAVLQHDENIYFFPNVIRHLNDALTYIPERYTTINTAIRRTMTMLPEEKIVHSYFTKQILTRQNEPVLPISEKKLREIFNRTSSNLFNYGERFYSILPPKFISTVANDWKLLNEKNCTLHRQMLAEASLLNNSVNQYSGFLGRLNLSASESTYKVVYYRSLQLQLKTCIASLDAKDATKTIRDLNVLHRLLTEGTMIKKGSNQSEPWASYSQLHSDLRAWASNGLQMTDVAEWLRPFLDCFLSSPEENNTSIENLLQLAQQYHEECSHKQRIILKDTPLNAHDILDASRPQLVISLEKIENDLEELKKIIFQLGCNNSTLTSNYDIKHEDLPSINDTILATYSRIINQQKIYQQLYIECKNEYIQQTSILNSTLPFMIQDKFACKTLNIDPNKAVTWAEIKKSYKKSAKTWHPDKGPESEKELRNTKFIDINEAYQRLEKLYFDQYNSDAVPSQPDEDISEYKNYYTEMKAKIKKLKEDFKQDWQEINMKLDEIHVDSKRMVNECISESKEATEKYLAEAEQKRANHLAESKKRIEETEKEVAEILSRSKKT